jgi:hypothetical protein
MATASSIARPRPWRLQFSLRLFLLAVLAFAIGFPVWYRWPYEEVEPLTGGGPGATRTTTWQRKWGGGRWKHGPEVSRHGPATETFTYQRGVLEGPYRIRYLSNERHEDKGQYRDGMKEGEWTYLRGEHRTTAHWRQGKLDGLHKTRLADGRMLARQFSAGRLTHADGRPVENGLLDLLESGAITDARVAEGLKNSGEIQFINTRLPDAVMYLSEGYDLQILLDISKVEDIDLPIAEVACDSDLCTILTLLTEPRGLACDYRYGCLWITTADDARDWRDPTGVAEIEPTAGSVLENVWNEPVDVEAINQPLTTAVKQLCTPLAVPIDLSQMAASGTPVDPPVTHFAKRHPFRHILGALLYKAGCRCELDEGTLIILPPAEPMQRQE